MGKNKFLAFNTSGLNRYLSGALEYIGILKDYEGCTYNEDIAYAILFDMIAKGVYKPKEVKTNELYRKKLEAGIELTYEEVEDIKMKSPQKGTWKQRSKSFFISINTLGLARLQENKEIKVSPLALKLYEDMVISREDSSVYIYSADSICIIRNILVKLYQNSPLKQDGNEKSPFVFLLAVLKEIEYLTINECVFVLGWHNSNVKAVVHNLKQLRKEYENKIPLDILIDKAIHTCNIKGYKEEEKETFIKNKRDAIDNNVLNFFLETELIVQDGSRLKLNESETPIINYIIEEYLYKSYDGVSYEEYYNYVNTMDTKLTQKPFSLYSARDMFLNQCDIWDISELETELKRIKGVKGIVRNSKLLPNVKDSAVYEYILSMLIQKKYPNYEVIPNYQTDTFGRVTGHAGSNRPDILVKTFKHDILLELTLLHTANQVSREAESVVRHLETHQEKLKATKDKEMRKSFVIFIAPKVDEILTMIFTAYGARSKTECNDLEATPYDENKYLIPIALDSLIYSLNVKDFELDDLLKTASICRSKIGV